MNAGNPTFSKVVLMRSAVRPSTKVPISLNKFSYSCVLDDNSSICLSYNVSPNRSVKGKCKTKIPMPNIPISPFPPRHRIPTSNPQLLTLPANRSIPTTLRLALSARLTSPRHPPTIARGGIRPLAGDRHLAIVDKLFLSGDIGCKFRA